MSIWLIKKKKNNNQKIINKIMLLLQLEMFKNNTVIKKHQILLKKKYQKILIRQILKKSQNKSYRHIQQLKIKKNCLPLIIKMNQLKFTLKLKKKTKNNHHYFVDFVQIVNFMITRISKIINRNESKKIHQNLMNLHK